MRFAAFFCGVVLVIAACEAADAGKEYVDPAGAFALKLPDGWKTARKALGDAGWITEIAARQGDAQSPKIEIVALSRERMQAGGLEETAKFLFQVGLTNVRENGEILSAQSSRTTFGGVDAIRCDLVYKPMRNAATEKGWLVASLGKTHAFLVSVSSLQSDAAGLKMVERAAETIAFEAKQAGGSAVAARQGASLLDADALSKAATQFKGNLQRESADTVLVAGDPPLTHASVAAFANLLSYVFDIQLTEAEFEATRQRFIEYYKKNDAEGRKIIALGGQNILSGLQQGSDEQKAKNKAEVKTVLANRFANGAKMGIEWAVVMNEAIARRTTALKTTTAEKPKTAGDAELDRTFSEADLEAALEMMYFMWVASGRDASLVTPQAVAQVRTALVTNFDRFPPEFQYMLCNAEKVYAHVRGAWQNADANTRRAMAAQFGKELDAMGLTVPRPGGGGRSGSAWDDMKGVSESELRAQTAANYAYLSANATSFSGRSVSW